MSQLGTSPATTASISLSPPLATSPAGGTARGAAEQPTTDGAGWLDQLDLDQLERQDRSPYADALIHYAARPWQRLTVPGHQSQPRRNPALSTLFGGHLLSLDVPPMVLGVDLPAGSSPLDEARALAARAWGAADTWFLTNGASQGNLAACLALRQLGEVIVTQRNVHSSVVDGLALSGLTAEFLPPSIDHDLGTAHGVTARQLDRALRRTPEAVAAYLVSPSYFGTQSDIAALATVAHRHGVPLVVDEAWGAHFGFHPGLPRNAIREGADLVISSTHKLAGSLTQSAMLHLGPTRHAERLREPVERALASLTSTSASAILLASLDLTRRDLAVHGRRWIDRSLADAARIRARIRAAGRFREPDELLRSHPDVVALDPLRVVVDTRSGGISGHQARALLFSRHQIHVEMATDSVLVAVVGAGNVTDADRFVEALHRLPEPEPAEAGPDRVALPGLPPPGARAMGVREARFAPSEHVPPDAAVGRVSADSLAAYPPGVPNVLPGEVLTPQVLAFLAAVTRAPQGYVRGAVDQDLSSLRVVAHRPT